MNPKKSQKITNLLPSREEGIALPIVILISALLLGLGLALSTNTILETGVSSNNERRIAAFYAAQIGLERTVRDFRTNYNVTNLPANQQVLYNQIAVANSGHNPANYTVTVTRRNAPVGSPMAPFPIFYIVTSEGRQVSPNAAASVSSVQLQQTLSVTPQTLANFTLFYNQFAWVVSFQSTFRLTGRLAVNDPGGVHIDRTTTINGDFYAAGQINQTAPFGNPIVSGTITNNGGQIPFPTTVSTYSNSAVDPYKFTGTTRMIFNADGTVSVYNAGLSGGTQVMSIPPNGLMAVSGGDVIVEGTVKGRVTVTGTDDILVNGDIQYSDHSAGSWDTLALVAQKDVIIPQKRYNGTIGNLTDFEAVWNGGRWEADSITGGTWSSSNINNDVHIDATLVALTGSSPSVINPLGRAAGQLYIYGNSISQLASVTIAWNLANGLNENYTQNQKIDILPPPGFPTSQQLTPTFLTFRDVRTAIR